MARVITVGWVGEGQFHESLERDAAPFGTRDLGDPARLGKGIHHRGTKDTEVGMDLSLASWRLVARTRRTATLKVPKGEFTTEAQRGEAATKGDAVSAYRRIGVSA